MKNEKIRKNGIKKVCGKTLAPLFILVAVGVMGAGGKTKNEVFFPKGWRSWYHVKSMVIEKGHPLFSAFGGIHHVYANKIAYEDLVEGKKVFREGAVFVFDLLEAVRQDNTIQEGKRKVLAYMRKVGRSRAKNTGGWEFQAFAEGKKEKPVVKNPKKECFNCHRSQEKSDYVFSKWRE